MSNCNLCHINLLNCCIGATDTYVSYDDSCMSTIDYIVMPFEIIDQITHCEVADDNCLNVSRHRPILCCLGVNVDNAIAHDSYVSKGAINWKRDSRLDYNQYNRTVSSDADLCNVQEKVLTRNDIDCAYGFVTDRLVNVALKTFPVKRSRHYAKSYWCEE